MCHSHASVQLFQRAQSQLPASSKALRVGKATYVQWKSPRKIPVQGITPGFVTDDFFERWSLTKAQLLRFKFAAPIFH